MKMVIFSSRKACLFSLCNVRICYYNHVIQANFPLKRINAVYEMNVFILLHYRLNYLNTIVNHGEHPLYIMILVDTFSNFMMEQRIKLSFIITFTLITS